MVSHDREVEILVEEFVHRSSPAGFHRYEKGRHLWRPFLYIDFRSYRERHSCAFEDRFGRRQLEPFFVDRGVGAVSDDFAERPVDLFEQFGVFFGERDSVIFFGRDFFGDFDAARFFDRVLGDRGSMITASTVPALSALTASGPSGKGRSSPASAFSLPSSSPVFPAGRRPSSQRGQRGL